MMAGNGGLKRRRGRTGGRHRRLGVLLAGLGLGVLLMAPGAGAAAPSAQEVMARLDRLYLGTTSEGRLSMRISTKHWYRALTLEFWSQGQDRMLLRVLEPPEERGVALLRRGAQVWNYLPKVKRLVNLPLSMLSTSCLGSHFTYEDLVKTRPLAVDYQGEISFSGPRRGEEVVEVTCLPKPGAPVVWGKVTFIVRRADLLPQTARYYDEDQKLVRVMTFEEVKSLGGRLLPSKLTVVPQDQPGERTVVVYETLSFDKPVSDHLFWPDKLKE